LTHHAELIEKTPEDSEPSKKHENMTQWKGIVGKGFSPLEFQAYVNQLTFGAWRPSFVVLHNTSEPRLSQWHSTPGEQRMLNLQDYYKNTEHWSAGPHLFVADDKIWVFTPLTVSGVHSPSWNAFSWGVEMVGEYEEEAFSPAVRENTIDALATLHAAIGLDPASLRFHKEDPLTTHKECPGKNVSKPDIIQGLTARLASLHGGEHAADDLTQAGAAAAPAAPTAATQPPAVDKPALQSSLFQGNNILETVAEGHLVLQATGEPVDGIGPVQDALNKLGMTIDLGSSNQFRGYFGEKTETALRKFQQTRGVSQVNGEVDSETILTLDKALIAEGTTSLSAPLPLGASAGLPKRLPGYAEDTLSAGQGIPWKAATLLPDYNNYVGLMPDSLCKFENIKLPNSLSTAVIYECKLAIDSDGSAPAGDSSHQDRTSLRHADSSSLNAGIESFAVLPLDGIEAEGEGFTKLKGLPDFGSLGLKLGDVGVAFWKDAPGMVAFVYGDKGRPNIVGEGSIAMAKSLHIDADPSNGGFNAKDIQDMNAGVVHIAFPGSTDVTVNSSGLPCTSRTAKDVEQLATLLFAAFKNQTA
jgi:peptidoglycan hydrolase-like protein with peptidoglycan-binding domain